MCSAPDSINAAFACWISGRPWFGRNVMTQTTGNAASRAGSCRIATAHDVPAQWRSSRHSSSGAPQRYLLDNRLYLLQQPEQELGQRRADRSSPGGRPERG